MQFFKVLSLLAVTGLATAQFYENEAGLSARDIAVEAHEDYLVARDEYIEKRELFRRLGGNGVCRAGSGGRKDCYTNTAMANGKGKWRYCGKCRKDATPSEYCLCNANAS